MNTPHTFVIRLTGDSGDGIQLVGEQLTITAALAGKDVRTLPDFPAEIRAPQGTVAGVSGFQLALSSDAIFTAGETVDVLVALNPAALKKAMSCVKLGGLVIINEDSFTEKDFQKAKLATDVFDDLYALAQVIRVPLISNVLNIQTEAKVTHATLKKTKNFYVLGLVLWLFDLDIDASLHFIQTKFKSKPDLIEVNQAALKAGMYYAETLELSKQHFSLNNIERPKGQYRQLTGIEALSMALATIATKTKTPLLVAGYPITPASGILEAAAKLADFGVNLFQAEDEIAAICACLGASYAGNLALTCTSGPGFDLKAESLGLAVMAELPLVVIDVQRAGASTGLPTKTGQSDLNQALYGRHGEAPIPILSPSSPSDCFYQVIDAFNMAVKYMTPVIVLMDAYLANAAEPWLIPDPSMIEVPVIRYNQREAPFSRDEYLARSWQKPGSEGYIYQVGGLEKTGEWGAVGYDADNHAKMVDIRAQKIQNITKDIKPLVIEGATQKNHLVITWGSTYGAMKTAIASLIDDGVAVSHLHLSHLNPLPSDLGAILNTYQHIAVAELNTGQCADLLQGKYCVPIYKITQCNGAPFTANFLIKTLKEAFFSKVVA